MRALGAALLVLLLTACGVPTDAEPRALDPAQAPFQVFQETQPAPQGERRVGLHFVRDDRVVLEPRAVEGPTDLRDLLELLLEGPTPQQVEQGIRSALPTTFTVEDVELGRNGVAVVTLGGTSTQISTPPLGFAQVVATLTAPGLARAVRFRLDGEDLPVPRGDTSLTEEPVDREDYAELLAPSPAPAAATSADSTVAPAADLATDPVPDPAVGPAAPTTGPASPAPR